MRPAILFALLPLFAAACIPTVPDDDDDQKDQNGDDTNQPDDSGVDDGKDNDGDGHKNDDDCDDTDDTVYVGADELCDGKDNDCDGDVDDGATDGNDYYTDSDGDGFGTGRAQTGCEQPEGTVTNSDDCDDDNRRVNPDAEEVCNEIDDDCDGRVDNGADGETYYTDADGDGFGDPSSEETGCEAPAGAVDNGDDCDDRDASVYPGAREQCDGIDNDCDDKVDDGVESSTWYTDSDGDGYGDASSAVEDCEQPRGTVENDDDCDDGASNVNPGESEVCDGIDNDCDGDIDGGAVDAAYGYADNDGDSFGDPSSYDLLCDGVDNGDDCDDSDSTEPQVVDGSFGGVSDGTASRPWTSVQDGIDAADTCVYVEAGLYTETVDFGGKDILVRSFDGAASTVIDGNEAGPVATFNSGEGPGAELTGFTLTGGSGYEEETTSSRSCGSSSTCTDHFTMICGGGLYVDGSAPTLRNLTVSSNIVSVPADTSTSTDFYYYFGFGGGLCVRNTDLEIDLVDFDQNAADEGGAVYVESGASLVLTHGKVFANTGENGAGVLADGGEFSSNNAIYAWNSASNAGGGVMGIDATVALTNVTVGINDAPADGGGGVSASGSTALTLLNSIIYGSSAGYGVAIGTSASLTASYSDVYDNTTDNYTGVTDPTGTDGMIAIVPGFVSVSSDGDYTNDTWTLDASSAVINTGDPDAAYDDTDGTRNDVGAYGGPSGAW